MKGILSLIKGIYRPLFLLCFLLQMSHYTRAQTAADTARAALQAIDSSYSHGFYLGFDIKITYSSDTLWAGTDSADFNYSEMIGNYTFNGNKALYRLGDIEYMQNDSFTVALYRENKIILVGKTLPGQATSSFMPTKAVFDTMMARLDQEYSCSMQTLNDFKCIHFTANNDSTVIFKTIRIDYDPVSFLMRKVVYTMNDHGYYDNPGAMSQPESRQVVLTFDFMNHRAGDVNPDYFNEMNYLFFDGPAVIKPAAPYQDFTIYKSY